MEAVPHDPPPEAPDSHCPICDVAYPCPERLRQRIAKRVIGDYLGALGYTPSSVVTHDGVAYRRWAHLARPNVDLAYGVTGLRVSIEDEAGVSMLLGDGLQPADLVGVLG